MEEKLYYGCAYYPELWDEEAVDTDIRHMKKLGINVVRMGEFAWSVIEPEEGKFNTSYFAGIIQKLDAHGIKTILCTPTATPPVWLTYGHPERLFQNQSGERLSHGARQHCCINHPYFMEKTKIIVEKIAASAGKLPGVIGWQIDNELKCHVSECYCETCLTLWHQWLEKRYITVEQLNKSWGTEVWSERYLAFEQVPTPVKTPFLHNASLEQAYKQFAREKTSRYCHMQAEIIRKYSSQPITHNSGEYFALDNPQLFEKLDFASFDDYAEARDYAIMLRSYDYFRMLKKEVPFWVMETSPNHNGCLTGAAVPHPAGYLKAEAAAAYISGAQGFSYWLFRQQQAGCEITHGSILYAWGAPTTGYTDVTEAGLVKEKIEPYIMKTHIPRGKVALMYSDTARITYEVEPFENYDYWKMIQMTYEEDIPHDMMTDVIHEDTDLEGYPVLYTPFMASMKEDFIKKAVSYVENGGIWITGPMCNYRTSEHTVPLDGGFGTLEQYAGAKVKYLESFTDAGVNGKAFDTNMELSMLSAVFEVKEAKPLGFVTSGRLEGEVFLTEQRLGKGRLILIGSRPKQAIRHNFMQKLLTHYLEINRVQLFWKSDGGIKTVERLGDDGSVYLFAVDMSGKGGFLSICREFEVVFGERVEGGIELKPYETVLVRV